MYKKRKKKSIIFLKKKKFTPSEKIFFRLYIRDWREKKGAGQFTFTHQNL
jgi:hypothetical protein